jgi:hypothetical protein
MTREDVSVRWVPDVIIISHDIDPAERQRKDSQ